MHYREQLFLLVEQADSGFKEQQIEKALEYLLEAYKRAEAGEDYLASAAIHNQLGNLYEKIGEYQKALSQYEKGLRVIEKLEAGAAKDLEETLKKLRSRGKVYIPINNRAPISTDLYIGEIENFRELLGRTAQEAKREISLLLTMNTGNGYSEQNQYIPAKPLYEKALEMSQASGLNFRSRQIYSNLAWSAIKQGRFDEAEIWLEKSLKEIPEKSPPIKMRRAFLAVGVAFREQHKYQKAIAELEKAVALYKLADDQRGQAHALAHLGTALLQNGEFEEAKKRYLQALILNQQVKANAIAWHAHGGLGKAYYQLGNLSAAVDHYSLYLDDVEHMSRSWYTDQGKVGILENHVAITNEYVQVAIQLAQKTGDYSAARNGIERIRARALKWLIEGRENSPSKKAGTLSAGSVLYGAHWPDHLRRYKREPEFTINQMAPGVESVDPQTLNKLFEAQEGIDNQDIPDKEAHPLEKLPPVDPPPVTFLEMYVLSSQTVVLVKYPNGNVGGVIVDIEAKVLRDLIAGYRQALKVGKPRGVTFISTALSVSETIPNQVLSEGEISQRLYKLLIKPIETLLPQDPQTPIVIVPHDSLWLLPFAALRLENGQFFGDRHVLTYAVSEAIWHIAAERPRIADHRNPNVWVVGNPSMPQAVKGCGVTISMDQLPGAEDEARKITEIFGANRANLFTGPQADRLRLEAWHPDFSIIHLATHGIACSEDPLSSFLVLSDLASNDLGFDKSFTKVSLRSDSRFPVTLRGAKEIQEIPDFPPVKDVSYPGQLTARTIITEFQLQSDLVTLSACQTGLGQLSGEGLIGFTRAFLTAGSRSLLVSLWRVDDQSTEKLMISFYQEYLKHGNKGLALQQAMAATKKQYPEPKYWAGFTLVGLAE